MCRGHRQDEAVPSYSQVGVAGLSEIGEEKEAARERTTGAPESSSVLEYLFGRVGQAMENIRRRLCQEGPGAGEESFGRQRRHARCEGQARRSQSSAGQARCRSFESSSGSRGDLRRQYGGISTGEACDRSRDSRGHQHYDSDAGQWQSEADRNRRGAQLQKSSFGRKRAIIIWLWCHEAFWQARQTDLNEEVCQGQELDPLIMQWTHSILEEDNFMNEWKASTRALDLQYEVDPMCGTHSGRPLSCKTRSKSTHPDRHPSFAKTVELYVGLEPENVFQRWPCHTGQAVISAPIFQPFPHSEADEVSWMAAPARREDRFPHAPHETEGRIMENEDIAINPYDYEEQVSDEQSSSNEDDSDVSEVADADGQPDWHTTVLFALDFNEVSLRLNWNDHEEFHHKVARKLCIASDLLYDTHHVRHQPEDLSRANVEAIIAHRHGDLTPGSALRLILIDVEFHHASPTIQPEIVRKVYKLPPHIGRVTLLHSLGLGHFCREVGHQCIIWHNHDMLRMRSAALINLLDGDFMRIAIPPVSEEACQLSTRTVATASHQGIDINDLQLQHALFQVGWRETVLSPPQVPLVPDFEIHDEMTMLQRSLTPELDRRPPFLDLPVEEFALQCKSNHLCEPPIFERSSDSHPPQHERERLIELQPEATRHLHRHWRMQGAARNVNEENIMTVYTWFLSFPYVMKCERHREVHLRQDFWNWQAQIAQRWNDLLEENMPFELHIVQPTPIGRTFTEEGPRHVILLQRSAVEHRAAVLTVLNNLP